MIPGFEAGHGGMISRARDTEKGGRSLELAGWSGDLALGLVRNPALRKKASKQARKKERKKER